MNSQQTSQAESSRVVSGIHEQDCLAERDNRFEHTSRSLYFGALTQMSKTGALADLKMHDELEEACFAQWPEADCIRSTEVFRLVGELHNVSTLDREALQRAEARIGKYVAGIVEKHLARLVDAEANRVVA